MTSEQLYEAIGMISEDHIAEADKAPKRRSSAWIRLSAAVIGICLILVVIPIVSRYKNPSIQPHEPPPAETEYTLIFPYTEYLIHFWDSLSEPVAEADLIVVATAEEIGDTYFANGRKVWDNMFEMDVLADGDHIRTPITFRISEVLKSKGDTAYTNGDTLLIAENYGRAGQYFYLPMEGIIPFEEDCEYILFLSFYSGEFHVHSQESVLIKEDGTLSSLFKNDKLYADCEGKEDAIAKIKAILNAQ